MLVLGIDPGTAILGYGVVEILGSRLIARAYGAVETSSALSPGERLAIIYERLGMLIKEYEPQVMGVEKLYFNKNVRTAMTVSEARGVVLLSAMHNNLSLYEYTPLEVKQAVVGYGKATKEQVGLMTQRLLSLPKLPKPDDVTDALAIAICTVHSAASNCKMRGLRS